jgi:DNA-binding protein HU-beta
VKHKDFIESVANKSGIDIKKADKLSDRTCSIISEMLSEGNMVSIQGFGTFGVKKREERVSVIPSTGKRLLIPPKLVPVFRPGPLLKEKIKNLADHG